MEIDDEIVDEFDVYLNKTLSNSLHVFEYDSKTSPLIANKCVKAKARANHNMFEIETPIDTSDTNNFDRRKIEQLAPFGGMTHIKSEHYDQKHDSISWKKLHSREMRPTLEQYAIAVIPSDSNDIHITPIKSVIQFRPSFEYIDVRDKKDVKLKSNANTKTSNNKDDSETDMSSQDENETVDEIQTIALRFAGPDEDRIKMAREKSFTYFQQQVAKDPYIDVNYNSIDSERSSAERKLLLFNSNIENRHYFVGKPEPI